MMRNIKLTIAYKGTAYHGFQVQKNALSVAEVFQNAVEKVFGKRYDIKGCSRTDSGVHARGFVVCLKADTAIPCPNIVRALNVNLPDDIAVLACEDVAEDFHPRYSARGKRYLYRIWNAQSKNPFETHTALHQPRKLDVEKMNRAAQCFVGTHDFSAFCAAGGSVEDKVRTIFSCNVTSQGNFVIISIEGDGFLYNMVRIIVGTLMEISFGSIEEQSLPNILASKDRSCAGATAPAQGLYLDEVFY